MIHIFIINYFAGNKVLSRSIRNHLETKKNMKYFVFNTVHAGFEKEIVKKICRYFEGEKLRFYCCGGSGTLRNMLDGFDEKDLTQIEVAFFPCGLTNDFLKVFENEDLFRDIDNLIDGRVEKIDYIKSNYGIAINTLSVGFDSNIEIAMRKYRIYDVFNAMIPYVLSVIRGIIFSQSRQIEIVVDGVQSSRKYDEIVFGNGSVLGGNLFFCEHANIQDGIASILTINDINSFEAVYILSNVMNKRIKYLNNEKKIKKGECKTIEIKSLDGKPLEINFDGELVNCGMSCKAEIVSKGLNFVIPKDVKITDYNLY